MYRILPARAPRLPKSRCGTLLRAHARDQTAESGDLSLNGHARRSEGGADIPHGDTSSHSEVAPRAGRERKIGECAVRMHSAPQTVTPRRNSPIVIYKRNQDPGGRGSNSLVIYFHLSAHVFFTRCPLVEGSGGPEGMCEFTGGEHAILLDNAPDVHRNSQPGSRAEAPPRVTLRLRRMSVRVRSVGGCAR